MFALNQFPAMSFGFPDVCNTQTGYGPVQIPYPNFASEATGLPAPYNVIVGCAPVHNLATTLPLSNGDLPGDSGVASGVVLGPGNTYVNAQTCLMGALPTKRMGSSGISNLTNTPASAVTPNQLKVLVLSP